MRLVLRFTGVAGIGTLLAIGLWTSFDGQAASTQRAASEAKRSAKPTGNDGAIEARSRLVPAADRPLTAPEPAPTEPEPTRGAPRRRSYDAVLVAADLSPRSLELTVLRRFWAEAADRGAPTEAIDALERIAWANADRSELAHAALDAREDLLALKERAVRPADDWRSAAEEDVLPPELLADGTAPDAAAALDTMPAPVDPDLLDDLTRTIRYSSEPAEVREAVAYLALQRDHESSRALLLALDHPDPDPRLDALTALWRSAADGRADPDEVRDALAHARYDPSRPIAALAELGLADLERLVDGSEPGPIEPPPVAPEIL